MQQGISAGHQETLNTAREILRAGGNAFDAAVAAHLTMFVAEPCMASAGGGGFALTYEPDKGVKFLDFFCQTPSSRGSRPEIDFFPIEVDFGKDKESFYIGAASVAVPGTMAGLFHLQSHFGTMPFSELAAIPIALAKKGVAVDAFQAIDFGLLKPILTYSDAGKEIFMKAEEMKKEGDIICLPMMADFLSFLSSEGVAGFYRGEIGAQIAKTNQDKGGFLQRKDFENYKVNSSTPLRTKFGNHTLHSANNPSIGGVILANFVASMQSEDTAALIKRLNKNLLDIEYQVGEYDRINATNKLASWGNDTITKGTSHFNILDKWGNAIALTTSLGEGNGTFIKGTQMQLNNMLGELFLLPKGAHSWKENRRLNSMMSPSMIVNQQNELQLILGSGGASRIPFAIGQTIKQLFSNKHSLAKAIQAPRMHFHENQLQAEFFEAFEEKPSEPHKIWDQNHMFFGGVHGISKMGKHLQACADPRRFGVSAVF